MRLSRIEDGGNFGLVEHADNILRYAVLSHTWAADEKAVNYYCPTPIKYCFA
jgi:hypothetical protein